MPLLTSPPLASNAMPHPVHILTFNPLMALFPLTFSPLFPPMLLPLDFSLLSETLFRPLLIGIQNSKKTLSTLYQILALEVSSLERARISWEQDLGLELTIMQWNMIRGAHYYLSANTAIQEKRDKIINGWHFIPNVLIKKTDPEEDECWRCGRG